MDLAWVGRMLHLTPRSLSGRPLDDDAVARRLWFRLGRVWPNALACCLMGNHLHLLVEDDPRRAARAMARLLGAVPGWTHPANELELTPEKPEKLVRLLRYIHLNPCRAGLVDDPLAWRWSTHRDLVGAVRAPWVPARRWSERTGWSVLRLHRYVSADPSADVSGTPLPRPAEPSEIPTRALAEIATAAVQATRSTPEDLRRRTPARWLFLHLAREQGWEAPNLLARACSMTRDGVLNNWELDVDVRPARLCLGDPRLMR